MNIREEARKAGGDDLVAKIDAGAKLEKEVFVKLDAIMQEYLDGAEGDQEKIALAALAEAFSAAFANVTAVCTVKAFHDDRPAGILTAIKSVTGNLNRAFEALDMRAAGISDRIKAAAAKGGAE